MKHHLSIGSFKIEVWKAVCLAGAGTLATILVTWACNSSRDKWVELNTNYKLIKVNQARQEAIIDVLLVMDKGEHPWFAKKLGREK